MKRRSWSAAGGHAERAGALRVLLGSRQVGCVTARRSRLRGRGRAKSRGVGVQVREGMADGRWLSGAERSMAGMLAVDVAAWRRAKRQAAPQLC